MPAVLFARGVAIAGFTFEVLDKFTGAPITTGVTCKIIKDGVGYAASTNTPSHIGGGVWALDITATERNAKITCLQYNSSTGVSGVINIVSDAQLGQGSTEVNLAFSASASLGSIWVTTQGDPDTVIVSGTLDTSGNITVYLSAGTYYAYGSKPGWNFSNPYSFTVA